MKKKPKTDAEIFRAAVLKKLPRKRPISGRDLAEKLDLVTADAGAIDPVAQRKLGYALRRLVDDGLIVREGQGPATTYARA